ncbi:MAG: amino acid adenylation domain-containing protein [Acidobacteria bacterium]|nr:amino acid adenylation domain-containing protein [Acidobacteriota bacterium]
MTDYSEDYDPYVNGYPPDGTSDSTAVPLSDLPPDLARKVAGLSPAQLALLRSRLGQRLAGETAGDLIPQPRPAQIPLSFAQQRLWFLDQLDRDSPAYIISRAFRLLGPLDIAALQGALDGLVQRHEVLRTVYALGETRPYQQVRPASPVVLTEIDLQLLPATGRLAAARERLREESRRSFDLGRDVMLRAALARLAPQDHLLLLITHHIASDGWSLGILYNELSLLYAAHRSNNTPALPDLPVQYADFAIWQRERLQGPILEQQLSYWREHFRSLPEPLELPVARPRQAVQTSAGAVEYLTLPAALTAELTALSRREGATLFMTLLAAFQSLLFRYTGQADITIGTPVANRTRREIEPLIGFFVNTLMLRSHLRADKSFLDFLGAVREVALDAYDHQEIPFEKLVRELQPARDLSRNPLFQMMFALLNTSSQPLRLMGLDVTPQWLHRGTALFDLSCFLETRGEEITGFLEYNTDLFTPATARRLRDHYLLLLQGIAADPAQSIGRLPLLSPAERRQVLVEWNDTRTESPPGGDITRFVTETAGRIPHHPAVISADGGLTYAQLLAAADDLVTRLRREGVEPGDRVGLCLHRGWRLPVSVLGVLRAGATCVPLDPEYPSQRLDFMAAQARLRLILVGRGEASPFHPSTAPCPLLIMEDQPTAAATAPPDLPPPDPDPERLAYILFTSGSTGIPKGVAMPHRPLLNLIRWQIGQPAFDSGRRTLQFASPSFDVSFQELFTTWASGGALVMPTDAERRDPERLLAFLVAQEIHRIFLPYVMLHHLADSAVHRAVFPSSLSEVITAGEQLRITPAIRDFFLRLPGCRLENQYGPTETHVVSSYPLTGAPDNWPALPAIGRPIANARLYVLDPLLQPVPIGVPGELAIGGQPVAQGYYGRPDLTRAAFVPDPFAGTPGAVMYRTGDVAVWREDGVIEFRGRTDRQVKIRGFRVEPREIEARLGEHPAVGDCAVVSVTDEGGHTSLAAYLVGGADDEPSPPDLREWLAAALPDYMIPGSFQLLTRMPRTASGKVDRRALVKTPGRPLPAAPPLSESLSPMEHTIAEIWADVLGSPVDSADQNFFDLGGHSLLAVVLIRHLEKRLGLDLPVSMLFEAPTIARQARYLENRSSRPAGRSVLVAIKPEGSRPPLFCVHSYGGYVINYRRLAELLPPEQPVWGVRPPQSGEGFVHFGTLEELAGFYIDELCRHFSEGPYLLAGYSSGGIIAFEMARQLITRGKTVPFIGLLDTCMLRPDLRPNRLLTPNMWWNFVKSIPFWILDLLRQSPKEGQDTKPPVRDRVRRVMGHDRYDWMRDVRDERKEFAFRHLEVLQRYTPPRGDLHVHVFRSRSRGLLHPQTTDLGWGRFARRGVTVHHIQGRHAAVLQEPAVSDLARRLPAALEQSLTTVTET